MLNRSISVLTIAALGVCGALGQTTTNFTFTMNLIGDDVHTPKRHALGSGFASLPSLGSVTIDLNLAQAIDYQSSAPLEDYKGTISFVFNRLDSFDAAVTIPNGSGNLPAVNGNIIGGKGAYQGATGSVTFSFTAVNGARSTAFVSSGYTLSATGNVSVAGKTTALNLPNTSIAPLGSSDRFLDSLSATFTASPLGSGTATIISSGGDDNTRQTAISTLKFNANDSFNTFFTFIGDTPPANFPGQIIGGTGAYAGATGAITANLSASPDGTSITITGSGAITTGAKGIPVITEVTAAFGNAEIAPNTWTVIKGNNLVPVNTVSSGVIWSNAPEFASGKMPANLQGVSVTVNGVPAYVYFYCSAATDPSCATDQINILTPLDAIGDSISAGVVVTSGAVSSAPFMVSEVSFAAPSFLLFSPKGHVVGVHTDASLLGPTTLYPGLSTPAKVGETVLVFAIGFGIPKGGATQGSATQAGAVQATVNCSIGGKVAAVPANIISPGLTQLNVTIPAGTPSGDNLIVCGSGSFPNTFGGRTPAGNLITVQ